MKKVFISSLIIAVLVWISCNKAATGLQDHVAPQLPSTAYEYASAKLPDGNGVNQFTQNGGFMGFDMPFFMSGQRVLVTNEGATLGRVLFYDKLLSLNNSVSCGSCHHQSKAFSDGLALSLGFEGRITTRSSMAIINPQMSNNLFWDSRSFTINDLSLAPVQNHIEMGMEDLNVLTKKLQETKYYPSLFQKAFGTSAITETAISSALSQFIASITTSHSKFDEGRANNFSNYTQLENAGRAIFNSAEAKCATCHAGPNLSAPDQPGGEYGGQTFNTGSASDVRGTTNIGLDIIPNDVGRKDGMFKIPSLRNIALTAPYMHDGRFKTLRDVIDHYSSGIKPAQNLDKKFKNADGSVKHIQLSESDKTALIAFLNTLTDYEFIKDEKYSNPFK
jgi:cytochrome c peroxidase